MASHETEPLPTAPYSPDLLADLHAGVLPESVSAELWPLVRQDPEAMKVIAALDEVTARLRDTGLSMSGEVPVPPDVAERIDRALSDQAPAHRAPSDGGPSEAVKVTPLRRRTPRRIVVLAAASVAAAIGITAVVVSAVTRSGDDVDPSLQVLEQAPTLVLDSEQLDSSVAMQVMATRGHNELIDAGRLPGCLEANGFSPTSGVLGISPVELDGQPGFMLVVSRYVPTRGMTILAVTSTCDTGNPGTLARRDLD